MMIMTVEIVIDEQKQIFFTAVYAMSRSRVCHGHDHEHEH